MGKYYASNAHKEAFKRRLRIKEYTKLLNINELLNEIERLEAFLKSKNIIMLNDYSIKNSEKPIAELEIIKNIEKCLQLEPFNILDNKELSTFSQQFINKKHDLTSIMKVRQVIGTIRNLFTSNFKKYTRILYTLII